MSESKEPDWPGELAKGGEGLRRQVEPIVQAAEQFVRDARRVKGRGGPALPFPQRVALAVDAGMRELLPARRQPVAHQATASLTVTPVLKATAEVAAAAGIAPSPTVYVYDGDVITFSESASVEVRDSRNDMAGRILALVLVWLIVLVIPVAAWDANLPPEVQALVDAYDGILANVAVAITFDILGMRNKR
jgi:hypothetical protein